MFTDQEIDLLCSAPVRRAIEENLDRDPTAVALDKRIPHARLVATQIKYLDRARAKLPSYYAARCILAPKAYEQSSAEVCAAHKRYEGRRCIDLTCGLGVDSFHLSRRFAQVTAVEADAGTCRIAAENFRRLGAPNLDVRHTTAEEFVRRAVADGLRADLIYIDPDRRDETGRRRVAPADCRPDITALNADLTLLAPRLAVKASPLYDVDEALRLWDDASVEVVSLDGECKELLVERGDPLGPGVTVTALGLGSERFDLAPARLPAPAWDPPYRWLIAPDAALRKARRTREYFARLDPSIHIDHDLGYAFARERPEKALGRIFEIESLEAYEPHALRRRLRAEGVRTIRLHRLHFPLTSEAICRTLGVREGGGPAWAFTETAGRLWSVRLK